MIEGDRWGRARLLNPLNRWRGRGTTSELPLGIRVRRRPDPLHGHGHGHGHGPRESGFRAPSAGERRPDTNSAQAQARLAGC